MFKAKKLVKICGITRVDQALEIAGLGVDAIGLISVKESPRYIPQLKRMEIFESMVRYFPKIKRVTVVKNDLIDKLINTFRDAKLSNVIQLHGDEDIDYCIELKKNVPEIKLWKAFRIKNKEDLKVIKSYENVVDAILLDSWSKDTYGGSGVRINQEYLKNIEFSKPWWLAGGISIDWIEKILQEINPDGIDISSSIETTPGIKDIKETEKLINIIKK